MMQDNYTNYKISKTQIIARRVSVFTDHVCYELRNLEDWVILTWGVKYRWGVYT